MRKLQLMQLDDWHVVQSGKILKIEHFRNSCVLIVGPVEMKPVALERGQDWDSFGHEREVEI